MLAGFVILAVPFGPIRTARRGEPARSGWWRSPPRHGPRSPRAARWGGGSVLVVPCGAAGPVM